MTVLRRIGPVSLAKAAGLVSVVFGVAFGLPAGCLASMVAPAPYAGWLLGGMGFFAVVVYPLLLGVLGFVGGLVAALAYNAVAAWVGGVEVEVGEEPPSDSTPRSD